MLRAFSLARHLTRPLVSNMIQSRFSQVVVGNGSSPKALEDWQYCKMITNELKNNNINNALSLLFQSYFNNQVLDIQIYNQMQEKMMSAVLPLSYSEIVYTIYREHFPPHDLMFNWMNKLTYSRSDDFVQRLKKDFQTLGQPYPNRSPRAKREAKKQAKPQKVEPVVADEAPAPARKGRGSKVVTQTISSVELPNIDLPKVEGEMSPQELYRSKISNEVKNALSHMNIDISSFSRIVVHDVSIQFGNNEQFDGDEELPQQEEQFNEEDMQEMGNMGMLGLDISKINIGRIEFFNDPQNEE